MRHTVRLHTVTIGHSDLEHADFALRHAHGVFRPGVGYDLVQPVFQLFAKAVSRDGATLDAELLDRYHNARDAMKLQLVDGDGRPIVTSAIHIVDYSSTSSDGGDVELDVLITDDAYWEKRLRNRSPAT
jgi:hypothetical protein